MRGKGIQNNKDEVANESESEKSKSQTSKDVYACGGGLLKIRRTLNN